MIEWHAFTAVRQRRRLALAVGVRTVNTEKLWVVSVRTEARVCTVPVRTVLLRSSVWNVTSYYVRLTRERWTAHHLLTSNHYVCTNVQYCELNNNWSVIFYTVGCSDVIVFVRVILAFRNPSGDWTLASRHWRAVCCVPVWVRRKWRSPPVLYPWHSRSNIV